MLCQGVDGYCHKFREENIAKNFKGCPGSVLNNDDWLSFIAGSSTISLLITPQNCRHIDVNIGVQGGIYSGCSGPLGVMDLQCQCTDQPFILSSNSFIVGATYYLVIDGCDGDICDYTIEVTGGSTVAPPPPSPGPISGDSTACGGTTSVFQIDPLSGVTSYQWKIDPPNAASFTVGFTDRLEVTWSDNFQGTANVCLEVKNQCLPALQGSCKSVRITPTPHATLTGNPVICLGYSDSTQLNIHLTGAGPWGFTPTLNGAPQDPIVTTNKDYNLTVKQPGAWKIIGLYQTESFCAGDNTPPLNVTVDTVRVITRTFCPGESVLIGGQFYSQPGTVRYILPGPFSCNSVIDFNLVQLPQPERSETVYFCPGESITLNGQSYTQPGEVDATVPGPNCDTLVHYLLRYPLPAPSTVSLHCPQNISETVAFNDTHKAIDYALPTATTDCSCPELSPNLVSGLPSGADFPVGLTKVCYRAADLCGQSAECCFDVQLTKLQDEEPCDIKAAGCVRYELLSITADQDRNLTYRIRVYNQCSGTLSYTAIQLPNGVTALNPSNGGLFTSEEGLVFDVRNPNASPFYSVRFTSHNGGLPPGSSATLKYTLPAQSDPDYIHVVSRAEPQAFMEAYLNTFKCPVTSAKPRNEAGVANVTGLRVYPNPSSGRLWVDFSSREGDKGQWRIYNSCGALMLEGRWEGAEPLAIDLPQSLASGLYIVECAGEAGRREMKRWALVR